MFCYLIKLNEKLTENCGKFSNSWKLNNTMLNNLWVKEEIKRKLESILY